MYQRLGEVTLRSGERVEAGVVLAPDADWAPRLGPLLGHKGGLWNWQNDVFLAGPTGLEARYYVLHRGGVPFSNILTSEHRGVGLFGHVYTRPADRQQGASSQLMRLQMADCRARGVQALYLGTGYDSVAYHMYAKQGFVPAIPKRGYMGWFPGGERAFLDSYLGGAPAGVQPVDWPHWPAAAPLYLNDWPGQVRCVPGGVVGRRLSEGPLLPFIRETREPGTPPARGAVALVATTGAVLGVAAWDLDPLWPETVRLDVYCLPEHWARAPELLAALRPRAGCRVLAYADAGFAPKQRALRAAGLHRVGVMRAWLPGGADALVYTRG